MFEEVKHILIDALNLPEDRDPIETDTPLLGNIPELDSMAVVHLITALEDHYGFVVENDEISGETFATMAHLVEFVEQKVQV